MSTLDMSMIQLGWSNGATNVDKIAEAEALASEALRMANEARRAAERLAEVKATLAMFAKQLDNVEKRPMVILEEVEKADVAIPADVVKTATTDEVPPVEASTTDEATPFETDNASEITGATQVVSSAATAQPKPETPLRKKVDAPVMVIEEEKPVKEHMPVDEEEEIVVVQEPAKDELVEVEEPSAEETTVVEELAAEEPIAVDAVEPGSEEPVVAKEEPASEEPIAAEEEPASEEAIIAKEPASKEPIAAKEEPASKELIIAKEPASKELTVSKEEPASAVLKKEAAGTEETKKVEAVVPSRRSKKVTINETPMVMNRKEAAPVARKTIEVSPYDEVEKDFFEAALDSMGLDRACGVDDATVYASLVSVNKIVIVPPKKDEKTSSSSSKGAPTLKEVVAPPSKKDKKKASSSSKGAPALKEVVAPPSNEAVAPNSKEVVAPPSKKPVVVKSSTTSSVVPIAKKTKEASFMTMILQSVEHDARASEKNLFVATLDAMGLDRLLGLDDDSMGFTQPRVEIAEPVEEFTPKAAPVPPSRKKAIVASPKAKSLARIPPRATPASIKQIQSVEAGDRDMLEAALDSVGLDRFCGIDEATLGIGPPRIEEPRKPREPEPLFENPTRISSDVPTETFDPHEAVHSESWQAKLVKKQREKRHLPPKYYQKAPTNGEFRDPFGVDHDALAFCGAIADLCEPNLKDLYEPDYLAPIEYANKEILTAGGADPDGIKTEEGHLYDEVDVAEEDEDVVESQKENSPSSQKALKSSDEHFIQYYIEDQDREALRLVDEHIWCI